MAARRRCSAPRSAPRASPTPRVEEDGRASVYREWNPAGLPTLVGRHRLDDLGAARMAAIRAGRTDVVPDVARMGARTRRARRCGGSGSRRRSSCRSSRGEAVGALVVHAAVPRDWTAEEARGRGAGGAQLGRVERARAEAAARGAERRRALLARLTEAIRERPR
jgi:hypothetical protein